MKIVSCFCLFGSYLKNLDGLKDAFVCRKTLNGLIGMQIFYSTAMLWKMSISGLVGEPVYLMFSLTY